MDPLSISAAVAGLLTATVSVITLVQNLKGMSELATGVMLEVQSVTACFKSLQKFIDATTTAPRSRTALIMVDEVRVLLTECLIVFSELKRVLDRLERVQNRHVWDVWKRISNIKMTEHLLHRLNGSRVSLTLMLSTLTCVSAEEAAESSRELRSLVLKVLDNDSDLARRFDDSQLPIASLPRSSPSTISEDDHDTIRTEPMANPNEDLQPTIEASIYGFAFDGDLQTTRVYRRLAYRRSGLSLPSSAGRSRGWSYLSDISLSEITNISIISLPLSLTELYRGCRNHFSSDTREPNSQTPSTTANNHNDLPPDESTHFYGGEFAELVANLWPPHEVALAFRERGLIGSVVKNICTRTTSGYTILLQERTDMAEYSSSPLRQNLFWEHVTAIQTQISEHLAYHHYSSLCNIHDGLEKAHSAHLRSASYPFEPTPDPWSGTSRDQESQLIIHTLIKAFGTIPSPKNGGEQDGIPPSIPEFRGFHAAIYENRRLRKVGDQAFRGKNYHLSTKQYEKAEHCIERARKISELTTSIAIQSAIAKAQFQTSCSEVVNWLKYTDYVSEVSRFQKALDAADRAMTVTKDPAEAWRPSQEAISELLHWRLEAYEGLHWTLKAYEGRPGSFRTLGEDYDLRIRKLKDHLHRTEILYDLGSLREYSTSQSSSPSPIED